MKAPFTFALLIYFNAIAYRQILRPEKILEILGTYSIGKRMDLAIYHICHAWRAAMRIVHIGTANICGKSNVIHDKRGEPFQEIKTLEDGFLLSSQ